MTHIKYLNERKVCEILPFLLRVFAVANDHHCLELLEIEVAGTKWHHEVAKTNQRRVGISKQTHDDMIGEVCQGSLPAILEETKYVF